MTMPGWVWLLAASVLIRAVRLAIARGPRGPISRFLLVPRGPRTQPALMSRGELVQSGLRHLEIGAVLGLALTLGLFAADAMALGRGATGEMVKGGIAFVAVILIAIFALAGVVLLVRAAFRRRGWTPPSPRRRPYVG
jgi:hypothetical protein